MRSQYYQDIVTQKSWESLKKLKKQFDFILIGGWAVFLYTKNFKSKDIDIIVDYDQMSLLKKDFEINKNERLKKYEIKQEGIDIDIYLPHYSELGLPVEVIMQFTTPFETFIVPVKELLLITKLKAYTSRRLSIKGQKDKVDIISLLRLPDFDFQLFRNNLKKFKLEQYIEIIKNIFNQTKQIQELDLNKHFFSKEKKRILTMLE